MSLLKTLSFEGDGDLFCGARDCENSGRVSEIYESSGEVTPGLLQGIYCHFKGEDRLYRVHGIAPRDGKEFVVYEQLYSSEFPEGTFWFRERSNFVGYKVRPSGETVKRFEFVRLGWNVSA